MCDFTAILAAIAASQAFLLGAIVLTVTAIAINSSFFGAPGAPVPFGLGIASAMAASGALYMTSSLLGDPACTAGGKCAAEAAAALGQLDVILATMYATSILGVVAMGLSAVPVAGAVAMTAYSAGLVIAAAQIAPVTMAVAALERCVEAVRSTPAADVLTATAVIIGLVAIGFVIIAIGMSRSGGDESDPFGTGGPKPD